MALDKRNFIFDNVTGETLTKKPGEINGQSFVIMELEDCNVFVLDHTAQIQVDDCKNCNIFLGPCKGSVFFRDCSDCTVHTATRQFRTRDVHNMKFAVYCPTQPSIETSTNCIFSCWRGAYPGLTEHLQAAELDPSVNTWDKIFDFNSADDLGAPHWIIEDPAPLEWVEVPVEGSGAACDNPILRADGAQYGAAEPLAVPVAASSDLFGDASQPGPSPAPMTEDLFAAPPMESAIPAGQGDEEFDLDGGVPDSTAQAAGWGGLPVEDEGPTPLALKMVEIREQLEVKAAEEAKAKAAVRGEAGEYLEVFYKNRTDRLKTNAENNRMAESSMTAAADSSGSGTWEKMFQYIDFSGHAIHTKDVSRFRSVLFAAKAKGTEARGL